MSICFVYEVIKVHLSSEMSLFFLLLPRNCSALNHKEEQKASNLCALCDFLVVFVVKSRMA
jgi:hypothetical protein